MSENTKVLHDQGVVSFGHPMPNGKPVLMGSSGLRAHRKRSLGPILLKADAESPSGGMFESATPITA